MENEVRLVAALSSDLKAASVLAEKAGLLEGPLTVALRQTNLTKEVQTILAKLDDCGPDGYATFLSVLSSPEESDLFAEVAKRIEANMRRICSHDTTEDDNVVTTGIGVISLPEVSVDVLATVSRSTCSFCTKMLPCEPRAVGDCGNATDDDIECVCCIIRSEECYAKVGTKAHPQDVVFGPSLIKPNGVLLRKSYRTLYTTLFRTAWDGQDVKANAMVDDILCRNIATDLKVISLEVIHTVDWKSDLQKLERALALSGSCENPNILTCRILRRLAGLHYRAKNLKIASDFNQQALQLAEGIVPDIDTIYTFRLQALLVFEQFKLTKEESMRQGIYVYMI